MEMALVSYSVVFEYITYKINEQLKRIYVNLPNPGTLLRLALRQIFCNLR